MTVLDYRSGTDERLDPTRPRLASTLGWAIYLAMSWTWCIGMFLPVLLVRDYGVWGWVIFAVPNVIGAAAMGWTIRSRAQSESLLRAHHTALAAFSFVTASFQIFFVFWIFPVLGVDPHNFILATFAVALAAVFLPSARRPSLAPIIATAVLAISCIAIVQTARTGMLLSPKLLLRDLRDLPSSNAIFLAAPCIFGFLLCPYLDPTFHLARQQLNRAQSRFAFATGFGVVFLAMIAFTFSCTLMLLWHFSSPGIRHDFFMWWLQIHFLVQLAFTIGVHWYRGQQIRGPDAHARTFTFILGTLALGFAAFFVTRFIHWSHYDPGELVYRLFLSFYGLVFPAYVWLCMMPSWSAPAAPSRGLLAVFAALVLLAAPMYWIAFIHGRIAWATPPLIVIVLSGLIIRRAKRASPDPLRRARIAIRSIEQRMEPNVVCPDCGKIIAPAGAVQNSIRCRCAEAAVATTTTSARVAAAPAESAASATSDQGIKTCYVCGAKLSGRTRLKDHLGRYWCLECAKADKRVKRREDELRCPDCGRPFPESKLVYFQATRVCKSCYKQREKELERKLLKHGIRTTQKRHEMSGIMWTALVVLALLLIATVARMMW